MKITEYSRNRILCTFAEWEVDKDFAHPIYNYLVFGYSPGSCFTAVLANDFMAAIGSSHPSNTVQAFKALVGWINDHMPAECYGSYERVKAWTKADDKFRRTILEKYKLVFSQEDEVMLALKGAPVLEPILL
jgi:hypothetical protein